MIFSSYQFIFAFLPLTFIFYFFLNSINFKYGKIFLVFSSIIFYIAWMPYQIFLLFFSIVTNYYLGGKIQNANNLNKKIFLLFGILFNLGLLIYFKYTNFFISIINYFPNADFNYLNIILPLAISFYSITQISFLVDSYQDSTSEKSFLNYSLFVLFFPHLLAGPVVHHKKLMDQFKNNIVSKINYKNIAIGLYIFVIGLSKKVLIADNLALSVNSGYENLDVLGSIELIFLSFAYTFQLYFDFSGYSDMAVGVALIFNIILPINFNSPYKSFSIIEFWSKWHMSLTNFINSYIFIPVIKTFGISNFAGYLLIILITMCISGIWHGANITFAIWGFLNGLALIINHLYRKYFNFKLNKFLSWAITFGFINFSFVFFRAENLNSVKIFFLNLLNYKNIYLPPEVSNYIDGFVPKIFIKTSTEIINFKYSLIIIILSFITVLFFKNINEFIEQKDKLISINYKLAIYSSVLFITSIILIINPTPFIYYNF